MTQRSPCPGLCVSSWPGVHIGHVNSVTKLSHTRMWHYYQIVAYFLKGQIHHGEVPLQGMYMFTGECVCILVFPLSPDPTPRQESWSQVGELVPPINFVQYIIHTHHNTPCEGLTTSVKAIGSLVMYRNINTSVISKQRHHSSQLSVYWLSSFLEWPNAELWDFIIRNQSYSGSFSF